MKSSAIIRIIIYLVLIVVLCGLLAVGLGYGYYVFHIGTDRDLIEGGGSVDAAEIRKLEIEWASGEILIQTSETTDTITFYEGNSSEDDEPMGYLIKGDTLLLGYSIEGSVQIGFVSIPSKTLVVTVPADWNCEELVIESASADATIENLTVEAINLDSASNDFRFVNCHVGKLDLDGASNNVDFSGTLNKLDFDGMSTKMTAVLTNTPRSIDLDGMSSKLDLTLPEDCGFIVTMDGLSNHFTSDFKTDYNGDSYVYGDRSCQIDVDGMSSDVSIHSPD